jgi:hypothetical protein
MVITFRILISSNPKKNFGNYSEGFVNPQLLNLTHSKYKLNNIGNMLKWANPFPLLF